jgi:Ni/Co efflux regulator RcnB
MQLEPHPSQLFSLRELIWWVNQGRQHSPPGWNRNRLEENLIPMNKVSRGAALAVLAAMLSGGVAFAADEHHDNHQYVRHNEWKKGYHMRQEDWSRGEKVDYRTYHLRTPPSGYEWREVDGNYVLAAVATGVIASVVIASTVH